MTVIIIPVLALMLAVVTVIVWQFSFGFYAFQGDSWDWLVEYSKAYRGPPEWFMWSLYGFALALLLMMVITQIVVARIGSRTKHGGRSDKDLHGSARWAETKDVKAAGLIRKTGAVVGGWPSLTGVKTLRHDGPEHVLCFAPTRSGKGVGLVLPTLLSWRESVLVLDIKGENWRLTSGYRAEMGHRILKFDPTAAHGSIRYNPLCEVRIGTDHEVSDAQNVAVMIIDPDGKGLADFWAKSGYAWLTGVILFALYKVRRDEKRVASLPDVDRVLTAVGAGLEGLIAEMVGMVAETEGATLLIQSAAQEMRDRAAQERSGVQSSSKVDLSLYRDPIIARNIGHSDFTMADLMNGDDPAALYLVVPPSDIDRLRPLLRVILNLYMRRLMVNGPDGKPNYRHRLLLMLDEFTSIGKLEIFERSLAFMAGYGLKSFLIVQDLKQLLGTYGKENAILGNCHVRIAYAPNDLDTAKTLSEMLGKATITQVKRGVQRQGLSAMSGRVTDSLTETGRPLLTPDECMRLKAAKKSRRDPEKVVKAGDMLILVAGQSPILGRQPLYFFNKTLRARAAMPPVDGTAGTVPAADPIQDDDGEKLAKIGADIADRLRAVAKQ